MGVSITTSNRIHRHSLILRSCIVSSSTVANEVCESVSVYLHTQLCSIYAIYVSGTVSIGVVNCRFVIVGGVSAAWGFFKHGKANRKLCSIDTGDLFP